MPDTSKNVAPAVKPAPVAAAKPVPAAMPNVATPAAKPVATAAAVPAEAKRKPGRPLGSKTAKAAAPIKTTPVKAAPVAADPARAKPIVAPVAAASVKIATKPVAPLAVATSEGSRTMNDTIVKMQDTAKKFTGEATARAKGAYEKGIKMTEDMTEFQKGNVEAIVESSKLAAKARRDARPGSRRLCAQVVREWHRCVQGLRVGQVADRAVQAAERLCQDPISTR